MGYRPTIYCPMCGEDCFCELGKFYGYEPLDNLESIKWLRDHEKIEKDDDDPFFTNVVLMFNAEEFREFITLYEKDINNFEFSSEDYIKYDKPYNVKEAWNSYGNGRLPDFETIFNNQYEKIIEWG